MSTQREQGRGWKWGRELIRNERNKSTLLSTTVESLCPSRKTKRTIKNISRNRRETEGRFVSVLSNRLVKRNHFETQSVLVPDLIS